MKDNSILSGGLFGLLIFAGVIYLLIKTRILLYIVIGIVVFVIGIIVVMLVKDSKKQKQINEANMTIQDFKKMINVNRNKVGKLRSFIYRIDDESVKTHVTQMTESAKWIVDNLEKNPNDLNGTKRFKNYYLDASINIVKKYVEFQNGDGLTDEQMNSLIKSKDTIALINQSFKKQKVKLLDNDFLDLKVEMEVLERTLKVEGEMQEDD
jgi:5-bromo-4-chloroindolyl phosphate hydrolysis protein